MVCDKSLSECSCQGGPYLEKPKLEINEPFFRYLMMMVSQFCAAGVSFGMGVPYAAALQLWNFSPEECRNLYEPGHQVLEKWVPFWLVQFKDEIALAIVLMPILTAKMVATTQLKSQVEEAKRRAEAAAEDPAATPPAKPAEVVQ